MRGRSPSPPPTLFFDRSTGKAIPTALRRLGLPVEFHGLHFERDAPDDEWLQRVGAWGWVVVGQDYHYHERPAELAALKQYSVAVFYLWGANATKWETMRVFARAYDRILAAAATTSRPFVYRISKNGRLRALRLP